MRKRGTVSWAAAAGLGSLVLLLAACGGSSSSASGSASAAGSASGTVQATSSSNSAAPATSASTKKPGSSSPEASAKPRHYAGAQPTSGAVSFPPEGTTIMIVAHTAVGYVLAEANGQVVYTYGNDRKGGSPTCTGSCASTWPPATGTPQAGPADTFPGRFAVVKGAGGVEQITYNGMPLYTYAGAKPYSVAGNGAGDVWHVVPLSAGDISA